MNLDPLDPMTDTQNNNLEFSEEDLDSLRAEVSSLTASYKTQVLETLEPSPAYRQSMHKMMLGLVTEDVLEIHHKSSWTARFLGRRDRFMSCWRELMDNSWGFRLANQGLMALAMGLLLSVLWQASASTEIVAFPRDTELEREVLVPASRQLDGQPIQEELPPQPIGSSSKRIFDTEDGR